MRANTKLIQRSKHLSAKQVLCSFTSIHWRRPNLFLQLRSFIYVPVSYILLPLSQCLMSISNLLPSKLKFASSAPTPCLLFYLYSSSHLTVFHLSDYILPVTKAKNLGLFLDSSSSSHSTASLSANLVDLPSKCIQNLTHYFTNLCCHKLVSFLFCIYAVLLNWCVFLLLLPLL